MAPRAPPTEGRQADTAPMADRIRLFDWSSTSLGPFSSWPPSLRTTLGVVLNTRFPMYLAWGDRLISLYNDAFRPLLGGKSDGLGRPLPEVWSDAWPVVGALVGRAQAGEASYFEDFPLTLMRREYPEQTWWTFSCSPVSDEAGRVGGVLCVAQETTRAVKARAALTADYEHLARLFDQAPGFTAFVSGPDHVYELASHGHRRDVLGKPAREAFPELKDQGVFELCDEVYRSGEAHVASGFKVRFADAAGVLQEHYVDFVLQPITDAEGSVSGIFIQGHDVTERMMAEASLREREERLRLAVDAGRMGVWEVDGVTGAVAASPELNRMLGLPPDANPSLDEVQAQFFPGERDRMRPLERQARERGDRYFETEYRHIRADNGEVRWFLTRAGSTDGAKRRAFGVLIDITERKEAEERLKLLALEVDHRANNLLATVQGVVSLTRADDITGFQERVLGRINALAHAHRLLAEGRWMGAGLARVVEEELQPYLAGHNVRAEGPDANLTPAVAQGLAIALHELVTNAAKYGALSSREGRLVVSWMARDQDGLVHMTWLERGGPPVSPPARAGFGMSLLRRALSGAVGGGVELEWQAEGLCCGLRFPAL